MRVLQRASALLRAFLLPGLVPGLVLGAALSLAGCGEGRALEDARFALRRGDLEAAERRLEGLDHPAADELRAELERVAARRAEIELRIESILAEAGEREPLWVRERLRELIERERDPVAVERVERVLSDLTELLARARREAREGPFSDPLAPAVVREARDGSASRGPASGSPDDWTDEPREGSAALAGALREHLERREWVQGFALLELARGDPAVDARELETLRETLVAHTLDAADGVLREAARLEAERGLEAAAAFAVAARERFPEHPALGGFRDDVLELEGRARIVRLSAAAQTGVDDGAESGEGWVDFVESEVPRARARELHAAEGDDPPVVAGTGENDEGAAAEAERALFAGKFVRASRAQRDAALEALAGTGERELVRAALAERWSAACERLRKDRTFKQLEKLAEARRELDRARAEALALIFDEERYFYPYRPPECPPEKARTYNDVQRRVDRLVGAVREAWAEDRTVSLSRGFLEGLEELAWSRGVQAERGLELALPGDFPAYLEALPETGEVGLADFAWDERERARIETSGRVRARNERLWQASRASALEPEEARASSAEAQQVRLTNDYREMFGRRALAWNPKLQLAARGHSEYMANTGDFGHFEKDPERRTPFDRMRLAGYERGVSENCHMGGGDPRSAHAGWTRSSGHHRNLLMESHREMASAVAANYWTQNFGVDSAYLEEL